MAGLYFTDNPTEGYGYKVGDKVEVYCDHEKDEERIRDWLIGTVVQVDPKMVAVQFKENVYLTDGWMVPDHVLWCPIDSTKMRRPLKKRHRRSRPSKAIL